MATIVDCPNEILCTIAEVLDLGDIKSLSYTCQRFKAIFDEWLPPRIRRLRVGFERSPGDDYDMDAAYRETRDTIWPILLSFARYRSLAENIDVLNVRFGYYYSQPAALGQTFLEQNIKLVTRALSARKMKSRHLARCTQALERGELYALFWCLVALSPAITSLIAVEPYGYLNEGTFDGSLFDQKSFPWMLQRLQHVFIGDSGWGWDDYVDKVSTDILYLLPTIASVTITTIPDEDWAESYRLTAHSVRCPTTKERKWIQFHHTPVDTSNLLSCLGRKDFRAIHRGEMVPQQHFSKSRLAEESVSIDLGQCNLSNISLFLGQVNHTASFVHLHIDVNYLVDVQNPDVSQLLTKLPAGLEALLLANMFGGQERFPEINTVVHANIAELLNNPPDGFTALNISLLNPHVFLEGMDWKFTTTPAWQMLFDLGHNSGVIVDISGLENRGGLQGFVRRVFDGRRITMLRDRFHQGMRSLGMRAGHLYRRLKR